ncbi:MAG: radical SAM protein [Caulobacter sp.]
MTIPTPNRTLSPFVVRTGASLAAGKFSDPALTARGERRAAVDLRALETLWFNTGTLCNLTCLNCYIESSPRNDALSYLAADEVDRFLDEIDELRLPTREIGFTGGEPFMNPEIIAMLTLALTRGHGVLVLTNAMRPMMRRADELVVLRERFGAGLTFRVSLDHHTEAVHDAERGDGAWDKAIAGLLWLSREGFRIAVAGRSLPGESEADARASYGRLFEDLRLAVDATDPAQLVLFPEMDASGDVPEITEACWGLLGKSPDDVMCSSSRMVVKRKGAARPAVVACTLIPHDPGFELGGSLSEALEPVRLNHPHCARFCVLGGGRCSA